MKQIDKVVYAPILMEQAIRGLRDRKNGSRNVIRPMNLKGPNVV